MKTMLRLTLAAAALVLCKPALAATATGTFNVTAIVPAKCLVVTGTADLAFGAYDPTLAPNGAVGQTTVSFHCTKGTAYTMWLSTGTNSASATGTTRAMAGGGDFLSYELYTANTYLPANVWASSGSAAGTVAIGTGTGGLATDSVTIYGAVPAGQYVTPASYSDQITVTINY